MNRLLKKFERIIIPVGPHLSVLGKIPGQIA